MDLCEGIVGGEIALSTGFTPPLRKCLLTTIYKYNIIYFVCGFICIMMKISYSK